MSEPTLTHEQVVAQLSELEKKLQAMIQENPDDADFWPIFAGYADQITDGVGADDYDWAMKEIDALLARNGKPPSDDIAPSDDMLNV